MKSSTVKANEVPRPLVAAGRTCWRLHARTPPFLHYLPVKLRRISTTSSTIDGHQSPHRRGMIRSRQRLLQWESYSIYLRTGVPQRRRQHLHPDDGIRPVRRAYSTNWITAQGRSVVRSRRTEQRLMAGCQAQEPRVPTNPCSSEMNARERKMR